MRIQKKIEPILLTLITVDEDLNTMFEPELTEVLVEIYDGIFCWTTRKLHIQPN